MMDVHRDVDVMMLVKTITTVTTDVLTTHKYLQAVLW